MTTITLNENQFKRHVELLETMGQMLIKEAETLRAEAKMGEAKISKRKTQADKKIEFEIKMQNIRVIRARAIYKKLASPEDKERYRQLKKTQNIII
ncbi:MAG: hypothetical protein ACTHM5_03795 [Ginsengibacter sp.]